MKITGLLFMFSTIINIVNSQPLVLYKESNNVFSSKEYVINPPLPTHVTITFPLLTYIPAPYKVPLIISDFSSNTTLNSCPY